ncbi:MAG: hypothetical protein MI724_20810 [Spirochaetales bacterium]|nr:hypothetical protein [Spirochaetales bacterium]
MAAFALLWIVVVATSLAEGWRWPTDDISSIGSANERDRPFDVVMSAPAASVSGATDRAEQTLRAYRFAAPGDVFYRDTPGGRPGLAERGVPAVSGRVAVRHRDELWTIYRAPSLFLPVQGGPRDLFFGDAPLTLTVLDAISMRIVNPRTLLPLDEGLAPDGLPWLEFRQAGSAVRAANLSVGPAVLVVPAQRLDAFSLPERIYVLRDGLLADEVNSIYPEALRDRLLSDGSLLILETAFDAGRTTIELEARRFDGSTQRRVLRIDVSEPPAASPLDTP